MQECEKEGGRKFGNSGTFPQQIVTTSHPHLITPSLPFHLSSPHLTGSSHSHPHHLAHPVTVHIHSPPPLESSLTVTMYLSHHHSTPPTPQPSPLTPSHHHPSPPHTTLLHAHPRTARTPTNNPATSLNRSKMESTVPSCVTCPVEALLHVRSIGYRLPGRMVITTNTPNATATTVRARGCEVAQHGLYQPSEPATLESSPPLLGLWTRDQAVALRHPARVERVLRVVGGCMSVMYRVRVQLRFC